MLSKSVIRALYNCCPDTTIAPTKKNGRARTSHQHSSRDGAGACTCEAHEWGRRRRTRAVRRGARGTDSPPKRGGCATQQALSDASSQQKAHQDASKIRPPSNSNLTGHW